MSRAYKIGLLQSKVHRILRSHISQCLDKFNMSMPEWVLLGALCENNKMRFSDIADILDVDAPFVTILVDQLEKKSLVKRQNDPQDRRAKQVMITDKGGTVVLEIEEVLKEKLKALTKGSSAQEFQSYTSVLEMIIKNHEQSAIF